MPVAGGRSLRTVENFLEADGDLRVPGLFDFSSKDLKGDPRKQNKKNLSLKTNIKRIDNKLR